MSVLCGQPSVWTLPSDAQSMQTGRRLGKGAALTAAAAAIPSTADSEQPASLPSAAAAPLQASPPLIRGSSSSSSLSSAAAVSVLALSVSDSGRLLCALTAQCVWLYSVLAEDCVCLGGWKRSPRLHEEEGDNTAVAFNHFTARSGGGEEDEQDSDEDDSGRGSGAMNSAATAMEDEEAAGVTADESHCVLAVLTSRHVLNVLRVAHRPDLAYTAQQHYSASDSGRPHPTAPLSPAASASASHPLQSSLSLSWSSSSPPAVAVSSQSSPCLFGFPSGSWHDAVTVSSAVHQPVSVHLLARVKLSNDSISCVAACRDGFLLGTAGGFVQRVALDGRPVSCMHAAVQVEQQSTIAAIAGSGTSLALRSLCINHSLHVLAFVLLDGRVGACDERLLQPTAPNRQQQQQQQRVEGFFSACWLQPPAACTSDAAVCVAIDEKSRRLAVGWSRYTDTAIHPCIHPYHEQQPQQQQQHSSATVSLRFILRWCLTVAVFSCTR